MTSYTAGQVFEYAISRAGTTNTEAVIRALPQNGTDEVRFFGLRVGFDKAGEYPGSNAASKYTLVQVVRAKPKVVSPYPAAQRVGDDDDAAGRLPRVHGEAPWCVG